MSKGEAYISNSAESPLHSRDVLDVVFELLHVSAFVFVDPLTKVYGALGRLVVESSFGLAPQYQIETFPMHFMFFHLPPLGEGLALVVFSLLLNPCSMH
jgi:hypothetical protein